VQVGAAKAKGCTISLQAAVHPGVLAAETLHTKTTTKTLMNNIKVFRDITPCSLI
jgi:hypothetical protein